MEHELAFHVSAQLPTLPSLKNYSSILIVCNALHSCPLKNRRDDKFFYGAGSELAFLAISESTPADLAVTACGRGSSSIRRNA